MKKIHVDVIEMEVARLCIEAAHDLPEDTMEAISGALAKEGSERGRSFLRQYIENAQIAKRERIPICQDTGVAVFFVEIGNEVGIEGGLIGDAIARGVERGYKEGFLRMSIVSEPLFERKNTRTNTPPIMHLAVVNGDKLVIRMALKGGGSENMSALAMLKPSDGVRGVVDFTVRTVINAGGNPCPPTIVGVGLGGNFEMAAILSKKALFRKIGEHNPDPKYANLENEILERLNASGLGPQGLGGDTTSFAVHIETHPCHIASLPVAVNLDCHASRHKKVVL